LKKRFLKDAKKEGASKEVRLVTYIVIYVKEGGIAIIRNPSISLIQKNLATRLSITVKKSPAKVKAKPQ